MTHLCCAPDCESNELFAGLCSMHFQRFMRNGHLDKVRVKISEKEKLLRRKKSKQKYKKSAKGIASEKRYRSGKGKETKKIGVRKRRKMIKIATPPWVNKKEMKAIYKQAHKNGLSVDHIMPLRGLNDNKEWFLSGLHVPWNLQIIPLSENLKKGSRVK